MVAIVAFTGKKGSGKDTAAQALLRRGTWDHINFADKLKEVCKIAYGLTPNEMKDPKLKQKQLDRWPFKSPRELMQEIAQIWRDRYPEIWVIGWYRTIKLNRIYRADEGVVVTDLRYPNEVEVLRDKKAIIIKIVRPDLEDDEFSSHESESYFDQIEADITITNDGTIESLHNKVTASLLGKVPTR